MATGREIKLQLEARGKSVAWLAKQTGIKASTLRSLISRDSWSINPKTLDKICDALGTTPAQLVFGNSENLTITEDAVRLAALVGTTPKIIMASGYGYWMTELTEEEAMRLGAKAYIKRKE